MNKQQQTWLGTAAGVALLLALGGCDDSTNTGSGAQSTLGKSAEFAKDVAGDIASRDAQTGGAADALTGAGEHVELSGLVWSIPASWENKGPGMMAQVELALPSSTSYQVRAKFYAGIRGSVQANLDRWASMMTDSAGAIEPRVKERTLDDVKVTIVEMEGNYAERLPSGTSINRDNFAFRAAVAEGPGGNVFIRLVGPIDDVEEAEADFLNMVSSMRRK
jgi:hypothetical protein